MSARVSRRELFGFLRRPPASPPPAPAPADTTPAFSLDAFYRARTPSRSLPVFTVRTPEAHAIATHTTRVGAGPSARAEPADKPVETPGSADRNVVKVDTVPETGNPAIGAGQVPVVLESACLATRSFCSVCVERCPRPGAIVVAQGRPRVVPEACDGCGRCVAACPAPVLAFALVARSPRPEEVPDV